MKNKILSGPQRLSMIWIPPTPQPHHEPLAPHTLPWRWGRPALSRHADRTTLHPLFREFAVAAPILPTEMRPFRLIFNFISSGGAAPDQVSFCSRMLIRHSMLATSVRSETLFVICTMLVFPTSLHACLISHFIPTPGMVCDNYKCSNPC